MTLRASRRLRLGCGPPGGVRKRPGPAGLPGGGNGRSNRSTADQDPAQWLPPVGGYRCPYGAEWVATKLRRDLAADEAEREALLGPAEDCPDATGVYERAL